MYKTSQPYNFLCVNLFATFSSDSNLASNCAFFDTHIEIIWNKHFLGHISTFCKLWSQTRAKRLKKSKNIFINRCSQATEDDLHDHEFSRCPSRAPFGLSPWFCVLADSGSCPELTRLLSPPLPLKVHKIEIFFGFDFEICNISLLVMSKY